MKIKVEKKEFDRFIRQFTTKGKLRRAASERSHINFALIEAKDGKIKVSGRKKNSKIMIRGILKGEVIENGDFQISDIDSFMKELKGLSGKYYEFDFGDTIHVKSGKTFEFPYHIAPADAALLAKLKAWDESHYKDKGVVKFDVKGKTYEFGKWFSIKESSQLNTIPLDLFNRTRVEKFRMETKGDSIIVSADNKEDKRKYYDDEIDGIDITGFLALELGDDIFPLFKSLSGPADFYIYKTSKGSTVIWCECGGLEWQITYKG